MNLIIRLLSLASVTLPLIAHNLHATETQADFFTRRAQEYNFTIEISKEPISMNPFDLLSSEPFVAIEARKPVEENQGTYTWQVLRYRHKHSEKVDISASYYWISCDLKRLRVVDTWNYAKQLEETNGYDPLGKKLPTSFEDAFSEDELVSLGASLPIIDLNEKKVYAADAVKNLDFWVYEGYLGLLQRFCSYK